MPKSHIMRSELPSYAIIPSISEFPTAPDTLRSVSPTVHVPSISSRLPAISVGRQPALLLPKSGSCPTVRCCCRPSGAPRRLRPGPIIDSAGHRLGTHDGAALYTIGQKKGLDLPPGWAVVAIDTAANRIVAGEEKLLLHRTLEVGECRLIESDEVFGARDIRAVIRGIGRNPEGYAAVFPAASGIRIELEDPAWAPAAGQPVVLYRGERVVGGGILERYY